MERFNPKRLVCGVDLGSVATKLVIMRGGELLFKAVAPTGARAAAVAQGLLEEGLRRIGADREEMGAIVSTGYGRRLVHFVDAVLAEVACAALAVSRAFPEEKLILDIGGQDSKAIRLDGRGRVADFAMNDRCAAGTGRFLEVMARVLELDLDGLAHEALAAQSEVTVNSTCTVFAESEVVGLLARGERVGPITRGIHRSVARRAVSLLRSVGAEEGVVFQGGCAMNRALVKAIEDELGARVVVPEDPQFVNAVGAAHKAEEFSRGGA